jgi:murein L,D-transpeptidase YcbB/YkuD
MSAISHPLLFEPFSQRCRRRRLPAICLAIGLTSSNFSTATDTPLWFGNERPKAAAQQAVELLSKAAADGLEAGDYSVDRLRGALERTGNGPPLAAGSLTALDQALTIAVRRYLTDLHFGRVDPRRLGVDYRPAGEPDFTPDALLNSAIVDNRIAEAIRGAAPTWPQYAAVREVLARYRELIGNPAWLTPLPPLPLGKLSPGQKYLGIPALTQRLILLGDLPATATPPPRYEGQLVEGVKSFQERHGMTPDGVIGKGTLEQLNVPPRHAPGNWNWRWSGCAGRRCSKRGVASWSISRSSRCVAMRFATAGSRTVWR